MRSLFCYVYVYRCECEDLVPSVQVFFTEALFPDAKVIYLFEICKDFFEFNISLTKLFCLTLFICGIG